MQVTSGRRAGRSRPKITFGFRDADTRAVLFESTPPRNDVAQRIEWRLGEHRGKRVYVEIVDGDTGRAFAWLAVGRFSHAPLNPSQDSQRLQAAAELIGSLKLESR